MLQQFTRRRGFAAIFVTVAVPMTCLAQAPPDVRAAMHGIQDIVIRSAVLEGIGAKAPVLAGGATTSLCSTPALKSVAAPTVTLHGSTPTTGENFGSSVASGDVNGDGYCDFLVSAPRATYNAVSQAGEVLVHFGPSLGSTTLLVDPSPLSGSGFGNAMAVADFNGDARADVAIAASSHDVGSVYGAGQVYVFLGGNPFDANVDVTLTEPITDSYAGFGYALAAGDVNGDSYADLVVGVNAGKVGYTYGAGEVYVFYGGPSFDAQSDLRLQDPSPESYANFGNALAVGDVNGDHRADIIVGARYAKSGSYTNAGEAFLFHGGVPPDTICDLTLRDPSPESSVGFSMSMACSDVNSDGYDDVIAASFGTLLNPTGEEAFVFFGGAVCDGTCDVTLVNPSPDLYSRYRPSLAMGDINGDNCKDVLLGIFGAPVGGLNAGQVLVFCGGAGFNTVADAVLTDPAPEEDGRFGFSLACGDINADGKAEVVAGAYGSAVVTPGERKFFGYLATGMSMEFTLNSIETSIDPFSVVIVAITSSTIDLWFVSFPSIPIVAGSAYYAGSSDTLRGTFVNTNEAEGTVSSKRTIGSRTIWTRQGWTTKRGGYAGEAFVFSDLVVGVDEPVGGVPAAIALSENYPNPFNPVTTIEVDLPEAGEVSLIVYNLLGNEVATLMSGNAPAGRHTIRWDASALASGVYFYRLKAGEFCQTRKALLVK